MVRSTLLLFALLGAELLPPPTGKKLEQAKKQVHDVYGADIKAAKRPQLAIAKRMLNEALDIKDDPAVQFVMLDSARDLAASARDWYTAYEAVSETAMRWQPEKVATVAEYLAWGDAEMNAAKRETAANRKFAAWVAAAEHYVRAKQYGNDLQKKQAQKRLDFVTMIATPGADKDIKLLVGSWAFEIREGNTIHKGQWRFSPDGTLIEHSPGAVLHGKWTCDRDKVTIRILENPSWITIKRPITPIGSYGDSHLGTDSFSMKKVD